MKKLLWIGTVLLTFLIIPGISDVAYAAGNLVFDSYVLELGVVKPNGTKEGIFHFRNEGDTTISIVKVDNACNCTMSQLSTEIVKPGQKGTLQVKFTAGREQQLTYKYLYVYTDDPTLSRIQLRVKVRVQSDIKWEPDMFRLEWPVPEDKVELVTLYKMFGEMVDVKKLSSANGLVIPAVATQDEERIFITVSFDREAEFRERDQIIVETTSKDFPTITIPVYFRKPELIKINPARLYLFKKSGVEGDAKQIRLTRLDGKKLQIRSVSSSMGFVQTRIIQNDLEQCVISAALTGEQPLGRYEVLLTVETDVGERTYVIVGTFYSNETEQKE